MNTCKERLTAAKALEISVQNDPNMGLDDILDQVKKQAEKGKRTLGVRGYGFHLIPSYAPRSEWPSYSRFIDAELNTLGYKTKIVCNNTSDEIRILEAFLEVSW